MTGREQSIPDEAAMLVAKRIEVSRAIDRLEAGSGNKPVFLRLALSEAESGASLALRAAWNVMDRIQSATEQMTREIEEGGS